MSKPMSDVIKTPVVAEEIAIFDDIGEVICFGETHGSLMPSKRREVRAESLLTEIAKCINEHESLSSQLAASQAREAIRRLQSGQ